jgi:hypothetical protein
VSLYQNSNDDLSALISAAAGLTVTSSQYTVLGLRPTTSADLPTSGGKNTKVAIQMNVGAPMSGQMSLYYDRLDLGALANFQPYLITGAPGTDVSVLLAVFRNQYGFTLTMADIADATAFTADDGNTHCVLTALATSLGYLNSFECVFAPLPNISTAFFSNVLTGF